jgi:hypothetical protein
LKIVVTERFGQGMTYAKEQGVNTASLLIITPQNWKTKLRGRTFRWEDIVYMPYKVDAYPPEFYEWIKVCVHSSKNL